MKKKEKAQLFENTDILDLLAAKKLQEDSKLRIEKTKKGMKYAIFSMIPVIVGSILCEIPMSEDLNATIILISVLGWLVGLVMAIKTGGGLKQVLAVSWNVVKWVWYLVPIFPFDLILAIGAGYFLIMGYIYVPVVYLLLMNLQAKRDLEVAESYITAWEITHARVASEN